MRNVLGDNIGFVDLIDNMGDDLSIVNSARVSYHRKAEKVEDKDVKLIKYLMENNHSSPLEHVVFTFNIRVPLYIERQWSRHRTWKFWSLNEISRRYTSEDIKFYIPREFRIQSMDNKQMSSDLVYDGDRDFRKLMKDTSDENLKIYYNMIASGIAREIARGVLPQNMYTTFYGSVDLHNLFWFLELRRHPHAQWEIQQYARAIESHIKKIVPSTYNVWNDIMNKKYEEEQ